MADFGWAERVVSSSETAKDTVRLLVYGPPGAGKTYLMGTFPGLFVIDTDKGLRTLKDKDIPSIGLDEGGETWNEMVDLAKRLKERAEPFDKYDVITIGIDSLSNLAELLLSDVMLRPPAGLARKVRTNSKPEWDHYDLVHKRMSSIVKRFRDLGLNVVATAGVKVERDDVSGTYLGQPDIVGGYRHKVGHDFDEYFYMEPETTGGKTHWYAYTTKFRYYQAKSRDGRAPKIFDLTYDNLYGKDAKI